MGAAGAETTPPATPGWTTGRVVAVVLASLLFLVAGGLLAGGTTLAVADQTMRNDRGFMMTPTEGVGSAAFAVTSEPIQLETGTASDAVPRALFGEVSVEVTPTGDQPVFVGVAEARTPRATSTAWATPRCSGSRGPTATRPRLPAVRRRRAVRAPRGQRHLDRVGVGHRRPAADLGRHVRDWVVLMNADGSRDVAADVAVGATVPHWAGWWPARGRRRPAAHLRRRSSRSGARAGAPRTDLRRRRPP